MADLLRLRRLDVVTVIGKGLLLRVASGLGGSNPTLMSENPIAGSLSETTVGAVWRWLS